MKVKIEKWVSSENQEEVHYFLEGDQQIYVLGYNPEFFDKYSIRDLLHIHGFEVDSE